MLRWLRIVFPLVTLPAAAFVYWWNVDPNHFRLYIPGFDYLTDFNRFEAATLTWQFLLAFGVFTVFYAVITFWYEQREESIRKIGGGHEGGVIGREKKFTEKDVSAFVTFEEPEDPPLVEHE